MTKAYVLITSEVAYTKEVLDGSVSLSLVVDDAEVDEGAGAYSWVVESQPWEEGDMLMLRIREAS